MMAKAKTGELELLAQSRGPHRVPMIHAYFLAGATPAYASTERVAMQLSIPPDPEWHHVRAEQQAVSGA
jgi:hypothetical protein